MSEGMAPWPCASHWLEALEWHVTLHEGSDTEWTDARLSEWRRWYAEPENRRIFEQVSQLLEDRQAYRPRDRRPRPATAEPHDPSPRRRRTPWGGWIKASAGLLFASGALGFAVLVLHARGLGTRTGPAPAVLYETGIGQLETVRLSDGSTVTLGAQTRLTAEFTAHRRAMRLLQGEAWFQDTDIPGQPFTVQAGRGMITAIGTSFVVNRDIDRVVVTVTGGVVDVAAAPEAPRRRTIDTQRPTRHPPFIRVVPGEALSYTDNGRLGPVTQASAQAATAWTQGRLIFDGVPLRYVVENVGRYWSRRIAIGPRAGRLRFSGLIYENGIRDWLSGLRTIFPVSLEETRSSIRIHMRTPGATQSH